LPNGTLSVVNGVDIEVVGCVNLSGKLELTLNREVKDGETVDIMISQSGCINGSFDTVDIKNDGCEVMAEQEVTSDGKKLVLLLHTEDRCGVGLPVAAIGGIVAGVVAFCVLLVSVVFFVPPVRRAVLPYRFRAKKSTLNMSSEKHVNLI